MSAVGDRVAPLFETARSDADLLHAGLHVEQITALAYTAAADGALEDRERARARRFAEHEGSHAAAFATMLFALTVPVREHARPEDLDTLVPGLRRAGRREALRALAELEGAAIAGAQVMGARMDALDALRTVATVMAGAAQHLVVLRDALGEEPLTNAYENGE